MTLSDLLAPPDAICGLRAADKRSLLDDLARRASRTLGLDSGEVAAALHRREDLGSTGVGGGVAIPHARLEAVPRAYALLARLREPVEFDAVDERPVDLVCLVLLPSLSAGQHLNALACVARRLRDPGTATALRGARDAAALYAVAAEGTSGSA